jgi:hypothetical protein
MAPNSQRENAEARRTQRKDGEGVRGERGGFRFQVSVLSGTTLCVVEVLLAEMREQPGGCARGVAMKRAKGEGRRELRT